MSGPAPFPGAAEGEDPRADLRWGTIPGLLEDVAARLPDAPALVDGGKTLTFAGLRDEADRFARALVAGGMAAGDRVAVWAPNCAEWAVAALGTLRAGGVLVTLNTRFKGAEAAYVLRASGTGTLCTVRGFLGTDYPGLLAGEDVGELARVVVLRDEPGATGTPPATGAPPATGTPPATGARPASWEVTGLADFLAGADSVTPEQTGQRAAALRPEDTADLIFTSGTTGRPKGAMAGHAQSLRTFGTWAAVVGLRQDDRYLIVNPFFHTFGYKAGLLACLMTGAVAVPEPVFDVDRVLDRIEQERISVLPGPPTLYQSILARPDRERRRLESLRLGVTGAAVVPVELVRAMRGQLGFETVLTAYGLTESCGVVTMCRRADPPEVVARTSGRAIPGLEVKVVDASAPADLPAPGPTGDPGTPASPVPRPAAGPALAPGTAGEVVVRGYTVMSGYWGDPEATAQAVDKDGWLHTGDIGVMDEHGNLAITDRLKDMFVVGGFNAYPAEVEAILQGCPGVAALAVVGVPDERLGEVGFAFLVGPPEGEDPGDFARRVLDWGRRAMANYKAPRYAAVVRELPVNASGKVLKRDLREQVARQGTGLVVYERSREQ